MDRCSEFYDRTVYFGMMVSAKGKETKHVKKNTKKMNIKEDETEKLEDLFDVDCNLTHEALADNVDLLLKNAKKVGVSRFLVPGSDLSTSFASLDLCKKYEELFATFGVHPYCVNEKEDMNMILHEIETQIIQERNNIVALGECGLDYSDGFPDKDIQRKWFDKQVELGCRIGKPLFLHERLAHDDFLSILDRYENKLPPTLVHCFTGNKMELKTYLDRGYMISVSGQICKKSAGEELRDALSSQNRKILLERIMIETDAPYLGFPGCQANEAANNNKKSKQIFPNVPSALPRVLIKLSEILKMEPHILAKQTTMNAIKFFKLKL